MRVLCVLLPHFLLRCEVRKNPAIEGRPVVITDNTGSRPLVLDYSPELQGLSCGMPLQEALALHHEVELVTGDLPRYRSCWNELLDRLEEVSPLVEGNGPGCAYLGLDGMQAIYPTDGILSEKVRGAIPGVFAPQLGVAYGKFPACLAALRVPPGGCRALDGDAAVFLRDMPCDALPVSLKTKERLRDLGIRTLGEIAAMPAGPLLSQFGPEGKIISELSRGYDASPLIPRRWEETIEESVLLSSATVALEAVLIVAESLLLKIFARDSLKGKGIVSITLWTRCLGAAHWERGIRFREAATDIKTAVSRIKLVLEAFPQPGPVEEMGIRVTALGQRTGRQRSLFTEVRAKDHLLDDIKQLELRLGNHEVFTIKEVEPWSRIPERRYALSPVGR